MQQQDIATLLEQSDYIRAGMEQLNKGLQSAYAQANTYDTEDVQACIEKIQKCVRLAGNNRMAALSARDMRKVMGELESAVEQLAGMIGK